MSDRRSDRADDASLDLGLLPELLSYQLRRAQIAGFQDFAAKVGDEGVTPGWFGLMVIVDNNEGLSQTQLARALGIDGSTMVATIDRLEGYGWIRRERSPHDRRTHALFVTDEGQEFLARMVPKMRAHEASFGAPLTAPERQELLRLLRKMTGI